MGLSIRIFLIPAVALLAGVASGNIACLEAPLPAGTGELTPVSPMTLSACTTFPNPFNPSTEARLSWPKAGFTRLALFDLRGRLVKNLVEEALEIGEHRSQWDGTDTSGRTMPSGIYLVKLSGPGIEVTRKITLAR